MPFLWLILLLWSCRILRIRYRYSGSFLRMCVFTKLLLLKEKEVDWEIDFFNRSHHPVKVTDMWFALPVGALDESIQAHQNLNRHFSLNGNASFFLLDSADRGKVIFC